LVSNDTTLQYVRLMMMVMMIFGVLMWWILFGRFNTQQIEGHLEQWSHHKSNR
jgi:hypothetical protein